jgi:prepilin-type N-terminal cleavage/methylation domain-containing protein
MERLAASSKRVARKTAGSRQGARAGGFTLIELMMASVLLVVGVLAMSGLVGLAVQSNGHSRLDTTAVMLTQAVTEQVSAGVNYSSTVGGTGTAFLTDCGAHGTTNPWPVKSANGGAPLGNGNIDFGKAKVAGYQMDYVICNGSNQVTYDVRWNLSQLASGTTTTSHTNILTVGARMEGGGLGPITFPINMRVMVGPDPVPGRM